MKNSAKFLLFFFVCCFSGVFAQTNTSLQSFEVLVNDTLTNVNINSIYKPVAVNQPDHGVVLVKKIAFEVWSIEYIPDEDYEGIDEANIEYYVLDNGIQPYYIKFIYEVKESIIHTTSDYATTSVNTPVWINILDNDFASHGPLSIVAVSFTSAGTITGMDVNQLEFTPDTDFTGKAYFNYVVQDTLMNSRSGAAIISIQDSVDISENGEIRMATTNRNPATILLPIGGFVVDSQNMPTYGNVSYVSDDIIEYTSLTGTSSVDTFGIQLGTEYYRTVIIETINIPEPNGFVVDDYVITTKETAVTFDVSDNDIKKSFPIINFSDELVQDDTDQSVFTYSPPAGFSGKKNFTYTVFNGVYSETGKITVWVNNFAPQNNATYHLSTPKNTPLVINYDVPITNFEFNQIILPAHGSLNIYDGLDTVEVGCDEIAGYNMVVYTPEDNFIGEDAFEIEYCVSNNECELVKVFVDVRDIGLDSICLCVENCVWVGDTDGDGRVSVADLLPIAYHQGIIGSVREEANESSAWFGQNAEDWGIQQIYSPYDMKHVDSNGDGIVAGDDVFDIENFYNNLHSLVSPSNLVVKDYPFTIDTDQDTVYAGEYLHLEISIGSEDNPVLNLSGLAYGLNFPPILIDSSSLEVDFLNDGWFGDNTPTIEIDVQPNEGRVEAAFSKLAGLSTSGYGAVATIDFIIEEDLEGIKAKNVVVPFDIHLEAIKVSDGVGGAYTLKPFTKRIYLDLRGNTTPFNPEVDVVLYPNPSTDFIQIHTQKETNISRVELYNMNGVLIQTSDVNYTTARLNIKSLLAGVYVARIHTNNGIVVKKFVKG